MSSIRGPVHSAEITEVSNSVLDALPIGGNVTYRPGTRLIKITTDPKVYAVSRGGALRWIVSEAVAQVIFGESWRSLVDTIPDEFFVNYTIGSDIMTGEDYDREKELEDVQNIDEDWNLHR